MVSNKKAPFEVTLTLFILFHLFTATSSQKLAKLNQDELQEQLISAFNDQKVELMTSLSQNHRLLIKPIIDNLTTEIITLRLNYQIESAARKLKIAEKVSEIFHTCFGEKSLMLKVEFISKLSHEQIRDKLLADSLYIAGTKLRKKADQRDQAWECYSRALQIYQQLGDKHGEGTTLGGMGVIYWYQKDPQEALSYFEKALKVRQETDDRQLIGNSYNDIGSVYYYFFSDLQQALKYHLEAEKIRREIEEWPKLTRTHASIGATYWDMGDLNQALDHYLKAIDAGQKAGDEARIASALKNCGLLLRNLGQYLKSIDYYEKALAIWQQLENQKNIIQVLNNIGFVYIRVGDFESALDIYQKIIGLEETIGYEIEIARAIINIGMVLCELGRPEQSAKQFQKALEIFEKQNHQEGVLEALGNLGMVYFALKDYPRSEEYRLKAITMSQDLHKKTIEVNNLIGLGNVQNYKMNLDQALKSYQTASDMAHALNNPIQIWAALLGMGDNHERRGEFEKALDYYFQALDKIEEIRGTLKTEQFKASYVSSHRFAYEAIIHLLGKLHQSNMNKGYDLHAYHYAEKCKARACLDLLAEALAQVHEGVDQKMLQKQEQLLADLSQVRNRLEQESGRVPSDQDTLLILKNQISDLEKDYQNLQVEIRGTNPKYADLRYPQPCTLTEVQSALLDDHTLILQYSLGDSSSSLWAITKDSSYLYQIPERSVLKDQVEILRFGLLDVTRNPEFFANSSYRLYQQLLEPVGELIKNYQHLLIIPDDILYYLPFEVLLTDKVTEMTETPFAGFPYLIRRNSIGYCQSTSVLKCLKEEYNRRTGSADKVLLAFGDPVFSNSEELSKEEPDEKHDSMTEITRGRFGRLEYSGKEVQAIGKLISKRKRDIYLREEATEDRLKKVDMGSYRFIHFATHGVINERKPDFSGIVLTQDDNPLEDGYLQAAEIFNLRLNADLVVLSACQTGLGKMIRGEGIVGLTRAFMYAGTPSLVVSLWSVSDVSTSDLMAAFYKNLLSKKLNKAGALQRAKISLIDSDRFSHPFYWAPFVVMGDWK